MKRTSVLLILIILLSFMGTPTLADGKGIDISIDGKRIEFNSSTGYPFLDENSRTQVPFRVVLEAFGATVKWDQSIQTAIAEKDGVQVDVKIGEKYIIKDGKRIENDTSAVILNGKTYLPIRKVMEAFGADVVWNAESKVVDIISEIVEEEYSKELEDDIKILEQKVIFDNDISIFTLYAFLNFTGYDHENNKQGYHEVRKMVRDELENMNISLMDNKYFINKKMVVHYYNHILARMNGAPNFRIGEGPLDYLSQLADLGYYLREFYLKADMESLFKKYDSFYQKEMEAYSKPIYPVLAKTNQFFRIDSSKIPEFYLQVNLLDSYWTGSGLGRIYEHKGKGILITGPSEEPNLKNVTHEYLHGIITPTNNELRKEIEELSYLMAKVPKYTQASSASYNNWFAIFDESMIRALDSKYLEDDSDYNQNGMEQGFILTEYFNERFKEFEDFEGTLKEFIKMLIQDIKKEK